MKAKGFKKEKTIIPLAPIYGNDEPLKIQSENNNMIITVG